MEREFTHIYDFIHAKEKCVFCNSKLIPTFTNFSGYNKYVPVIKSRLTGSNFDFQINYITSDIQLKADVRVDVTNNMLQFEVLESCWEDIVSPEKVIEVFESFKPHIELSCENKHCLMNYYLCSNIFRCDRDHVFANHAYIKPFMLYWESCNIGKFWVQNDWIHGATNIISTVHPELSPMEVPMIDFSSFNEETLKTRISTILTFS